MTHRFKGFIHPLLILGAVAVISAASIAQAATIQSETSVQAREQHPILSASTQKASIAPYDANVINQIPTAAGNASAQDKATINDSTANYDGHLKNFPSRKVTIVVPATLKNEKTAQFGQYMTERVSSLLKYPYYDTTIVSTNTPTANISATDLTQIAAAQNSNIVIMPVPIQDTYVQLNSINKIPPADNDEIYITAKVSGLLYYYDINDKIVHTVRSGFNQTDDTLTMPTHKMIWNKVVSMLLDQLPYKRIPTDQDRYQAPGVNAESPVVLDFQVEQPKNTAYSLKGVSVL
ncbi:hypothetical protein VEHSUH05_03190 [Veillonella denticariosi JCM 15641]|uniref:Uncharacterized protein n=1 Tax=Veillonella denticariosi JCM 15641 TaxID=1298594 RepID=A0A2S7Z9Y0_9FIRM|nr:hypothetical protein [Veillonella denticariosi]PQL20088.1 hypothetical protein VEHSUH05_03190 [Veillonella denticariosi JCM 15641]